MKNARIVFMAFGIAFLMFVIAPIASAQSKPDFLVWEGTFLKLKGTLKGYYYSATAVNNLDPYDYKTIENVSQWGIVRGDGVGNFAIEFYSKGANKECFFDMILPLEYLAGSQVDFVARFLVNEIDNYATGLVYVKAQLDKTGTAIKQGGTISAVAAYVIERGLDEPSDLAASGLTLKGNVVKELGCTPVPR